MKKITTSIESCIRYFEDELIRNEFLTFQVVLPKDVSREIATFNVLTKFNEQSKKVLKQSFKISSDHITFFNSHEDPLLEHDNNIYLSLHVPTEILSYPFDSIFIYVEGLKENDFSANFNHLSSSFFNSNLKSYIDINNSIITTKEKTILTLHLGNREGIYTEKFFILNKKESFCFKKYIENYSYIGLQCSYEGHSIEIEEKHIIKGQKGIYETGILKDEYGKLIAQGLLPFNKINLNNFMINHNDSFGFKEVFTINDVLNHHQFNPIRFFESSLNFLKPSYIKENTYSQSRLFKKSKESNLSHLNLTICKECKFNTECIQVVPSGLSYELMKINVKLSDCHKCPIYNLVEQARL